MSVQDPTPDAELARARELAVAFLLDEIDDAGLRELHGLLSGPRASEVAAAAWQQLDGAVDLRVQLGGPAFTDMVRLRLDDDGAFARLAQRRLGTRRSLDPVAEPPPPPRRWRRRLLWFCVPMLIAMLVSWLVLRSEPPARVVAVTGLPVAGGGAVVPGTGLDASAPLSLPAGADATLRWRDGSLAVISGPASAVVQSGGLSLVGGSAWLVAGPAGLRLGTPDRQAVVPYGSRIAVGVADGSSAVGVPAAAPAIPGLPAPGRFAIGGSEAAWLPEHAVGGAVALDGAWWDLDAQIDGWTGDGRLLIALEPGPAVAVGPGTLAVGRSDAPAAPLTGAPQAGRHLHLAVRGLHLTITVDGADPRVVELRQPPSALRIERSGLRGPEPVLRSGPAPAPPAALTGW